MKNEQGKLDFKNEQIRLLQEELDKANEKIEADREYIYALEMSDIQKKERIKKLNLSLRELQAALWNFIYLLNQDMDD